VTSLNLARRPAADLRSDALVVATTKGSDGAVLVGANALPQEAATHLTTAIATLRLTGAAEEVARVVAVPGIASASVVLVGLGSADGDAHLAPDRLRRSAGAASRSLVGKAERVVLALPTPDLETLGAVAEGAFAGTYRYEAAPGPAPKELTVDVVSDSGRGAAAARAVERAAVVGSRVALVRDLVNLPANLLTPATFATRVRSEARRSTAKLSVSVIDEANLRKQGCGGILGVGQGSAVPPRIVSVTYAPAKPKARIALVGKGITFDTGGYRIKPIEGMVTMKCDMGGAAAVLGAVLAAAELGLPVAVTGWLCLAENMISGSAQRPGDVVTMANGMRVEVLDPDAEGRMVLGDGMVLASRQSPDVLVDIATLTGMQAVALGKGIAGLMGNDDATVDRIRASGTAAGEAYWPMPLPAEYRASLDSPVADIAHKADAQGGMLTAGLFLKEFVGEGIPWAHLDIASTGWNSAGPNGWLPKGGTGFGTSTLVRFLESYA
jgi:leucyl aminopeptidase